MINYPATVTVKSKASYILQTYNVTEYILLLQKKKKKKRGMSEEILSQNKTKAPREDSRS